MLVNHLCNCVTKQHNILVKRFDLPLQLDAVDKINRHRNMLATQGVEKWILQELAFVVAHDIFRVQKFIELKVTTATLTFL